MRRKLTVLLVLCFAAVALQAQVPEKMSYQAVIRNSSDELVKNTKIGMRISILQGSVTGTEVYSETQTPTTNANGLVSIEFGGGTGFDAIDWSSGVYFLKTETDISGGTNYTITGTSQLLSVPYALYAKTAGNVPYSQITGMPAANQPPTCSITAPANNAIIKDGDTIKVTANDADGSIADVQLFVNDVFYSSKIASPYNFTVKDLPLGNHAITALARDNQGATTKSTVLNILISAYDSCTVSPNYGTITPINMTAEGGDDYIFATFDLTSHGDAITFILEEYGIFSKASVESEQEHLPLSVQNGATRLAERAFFCLIIMETRCL